MTLTKDRIIESIYLNAGIKKYQAARLFESIIEVMKKTLESGEDVLISGFGKFSVKDKNERRGRNPATGTELTLDARRVVSFRCSPVLRERISGKG